MVKEFETHQVVLQEGSFLMVCRLALLDTIQDIPVFKLKQGKSVLKQSRMAIADCLGYSSTLNLISPYLFTERFENTLMAEIQTKTGALLDQVGGTERELPEGPKITLMDFLNRRPETIQNNQFVEVIILISFWFQNLFWSK